MDPREGAASSRKMHRPGVHHGKLAYGQGVRHSSGGVLRSRRAAHLATRVAEKIGKAMSHYDRTPATLALQPESGRHLWSFIALHSKACLMTMLLRRKTDTLLP